MRKFLERFAVNLFRIAFCLWGVGVLVGIAGGAGEIDFLWYLGVFIMLTSVLMGVFGLSLGVYLYSCVPCWKDIV